MMRNTDARLQALEARFLPLPAIEPMFVKIRDSSIAEPGQPEPQPVTDADLTGYASGAVHVPRMPGESLADLQARCRQVAPTAIVWLARYAGRGV
jgi:hypothetical protein